jgi:hypothetical protein
MELKALPCESWWWSAGELYMVWTSGALASIAQVRVAIVAIVFLRFLRCSSCSSDGAYSQWSSWGFLPLDNHFFSTTTKLAFVVRSRRNGATIISMIIPIELGTERSDAAAPPRAPAAWAQKAAADTKACTRYGSTASGPPPCPCKGALSTRSQRRIPTATSSPLTCTTQARKPHPVWRRIEGSPRRRARIYGLPESRTWIDSLIVLPIEVEGLDWAADPHSVVRSIHWYLQHLRPFGRRPQRQPRCTHLRVGSGMSPRNPSGSSWGGRRGRRGRGTSTLPHLLGHPGRAMLAAPGATVIAAASSRTAATSWVCIVLA